MQCWSREHFCIESKVPTCIFLYFVNVDSNRWLKSCMSLREKLNDSCMATRRRVWLLTSAFFFSSTLAPTSRSKGSSQICFVNCLCPTTAITSLITCNSSDRHNCGLNWKPQRLFQSRLKAFCSRDRPVGLEWQRERRRNTHARHT